MIATLALYADIRPRRFRLQALITPILTMIARARQRRALAGFDDRLLRDIGISRVEATREIRKSFWQA